MESMLLAVLVIAKLAFWGACLLVLVLICRNFWPSSSANKRTKPRRRLGPHSKLTESFDGGSASIPWYGDYSNSTCASEPGQGGERGGCESGNDAAGSDSNGCDSGGDSGGSD